MGRFKSNRRMIPGVRAMQDAIGQGQSAAPTPATNPGDMENWVTDRIVLDVAAPATSNTGTMEHWITDRLTLNTWAGRSA